eukprot:gnl/MRDRNA2_/MRDRNA2_131817_c0_seq1.p1 gnl/MRDRNA2_/MRDRNA2_131817_c0~~gnl/MRDRNA2_/MRDRNA2_131817_c0_seq1.p1  ORF type:complete len:597 (-),score=108.12 gnl/MRDRNA2_/MRDRNA2_131817_c0_seq1:117-1907(-)
MAPLMEEPAGESIPEEPSWEPSWIKKQAANLPCYDGGATIRRSRNFAAHRAPPVPRRARTVEEKQSTGFGQYIPTANPAFKGGPPATPPPPSPGRPMGPPPPGRPVGNPLTPPAPVGNPTAPVGNPEPFRCSTAPVGRCATAPAASRPPFCPSPDPTAPAAPDRYDPEAPMEAPPSMFEGMDSSSDARLPSPKATPQAWTPQPGTAVPNPGSPKASMNTPASGNANTGYRVNSKTSSSSEPGVKPSAEKRLSGVAERTSSSPPEMKPKESCFSVDASNKKLETRMTPNKLVQNLFANLKLTKVTQIPQAKKCNNKRPNSCFGGCLPSTDDSDSETELQKAKAKTKEKVKRKKEETVRMLKEEHRQSWGLPSRSQWWKPGVWIAAARCHLGSENETTACPDATINSASNSKFVGAPVEPNRFTTAMPSPPPPPKVNAFPPSTSPDQAGSRRSFSSEPRKSSEKGNAFQGMDLPGSPSKDVEEETCSTATGPSSFCRVPSSSFGGSSRTISSGSPPKPDDFTELVSSLRRLGRVEAEQSLLSELDRIASDPRPEERRRRIRALQRSIHPDKWPQEQQELATILFQTLQSRKDQVCPNW